ncbi:MAG: SCO family protein [Candidatus Eremiobacteraeota bacterium]|nr:SCO family protein [Candidatus Eremiobacteraeota bacterium]
MTRKRVAVVFAAAAAAAISACTNGGGLGTIGGGGGTPSPPPATGIGVAIPTGKIGVENDPVWGTVGGYTQNKTSQVLAFAPGATITITNFSKTTSHTLNVISQTKGPPANFPSSGSVSLPFSPRGNGVLGPSYASGTLNAGASVKVKLSKPGIYLIGCAFHYGLGMRDVIQVVAGATPGPTASPGPGGYLERRPDPIGEAHLIDQRGRAFTLQALHGRPVVMTFVSAHCTDACPLINAQFSDAGQRLRRDGVAAQLLTVTLDPQRDTPPVMAALARRFAADPHYWLLASGTPKNVRAVMKRFGVISVEGRPGESERHTTFVYLLDARGRLTQTMLASTALSDAIVDALRGQKEVAQR